MAKHEEGSHYQPFALFSNATSAERFADDFYTKDKENERWDFEFFQLNIDPRNDLQREVETIYLQKNVVDPDDHSMGAFTKLVEVKAIENSDG